DGGAEKVIRFGIRGLEIADEIDELRGEIYRCRIRAAEAVATLDEVGGVDAPGQKHAAQVESVVHAREIGPELRVARNAVRVLQDAVVGGGGVGAPGELKLLDTGLQRECRGDERAGDGDVDVGSRHG